MTVERNIELAKKEDRLQHTRFMNTGKPITHVGKDKSFTLV